jgi:hypothetical protein
MWDFLFGMLIGALPEKIAWGCILIGLAVLAPIVLWLWLR